MMNTKQTEALKLARDVMKHTRNCLYQSLAQDDVVCDCGVTMARAAIREALAEQPAQQQEQEGPINDGWQITVAHGHSGYGVYAHMEDYPEEGAVLVQTIEQPAQQQVDWEKLYRLEVKKKEALAAKYERDTGKKLTRIVPMAEQPAQQQDLPDFIAGALGVSRGTAYDLMREALAEQPAQQQEQYIGETNVELGFYSDDASNGQQRELVGKVEMGQLVGNRPHESTSNPDTEREIAVITGVDEYGPMLGWFKHWINYPVGTKLYTSPPASKPLTPREVELLDGMIEVQLDHAKRCDSIGNRPMAEKQKAWDMERVELLRKLKAAHGITGEK